MIIIEIIFTILFFIGIFLVIFAKQITEIYWATIESLLNRKEFDLVDLMFKLIE